MKILTGLLLCLLGWQAALPAAASSRLEHTTVFGRDCINLEDWARQNGLSSRWITRNEELRIVGGNATLSWSANAARFQFNHISIWLSQPVAMKDGNAYLSALDFKSTLQPLLFPEVSKTRGRVRTICLDPGHGGEDSGKRDGRNLEKKYTLLLAEELSARLKQAGLNVVLTRTTDKRVELDDRTSIAHQRGADAFVSLHFNADASGSARGAEVYCMTPVGAASTNARGEGAEQVPSPGNRNDARNLLLAFSVHKNLIRRLQVEDRGVRRARFQVLREATMPAILIEAGFMSNPTDSRRIYSAKERVRLAQSIVEGILAYKKIVESPADE